MVGKIICRKAIVNDIPSISEILIKLNSQHNKEDNYFLQKKGLSSKTEVYVRNCFSSKNHFFAVAEVGAGKEREVIGYIHANISKRPPIFAVSEELYVGELFVKINYREKGVAKKLFGLVKAFAKKRRVKYVQLKVYSKNNPAKKLYESLKMNLVLDYYVLKV